MYVFTGPALDDNSTIAQQYEVHVGDDAGQVGEPVYGVRNSPGGTIAMVKFDSMSFYEKNTTFFSDFKILRTQWFEVEDRISNIKDEYDPVDWGRIRDSAKEVVMKHERLMVKFARDCRSAKSKLPPAEGAQAQHAIEMVLEYLDSVGLVVLKLYEISEKLYKKTLDPYSYTMSEYNDDFRHFKELNVAFEKKGKMLNQFLYGNYHRPLGMVLKEKRILRFLRSRSNI